MATDTVDTGLVEEMVRDIVGRELEFLELRMVELKKEMPELQKFVTKFLVKVRGRFPEIQRWILLRGKDDRWILRVEIRSTEQDNLVRWDVRDIAVRLGLDRMNIDLYIDKIV